MKAIYWLLTRFGWGFGLVSAPLGLVRDIGIVFLVFKAFGITLGLVWDGVIGVIIFGILVLIGEWLKRKGYLNYAAKLGNQVNPWDEKLDKIYEMVKQRQ